jgi:predicted amino acid-binding ACT domain protein
MIHLSYYKDVWKSKNNKSLQKVSKLVIKNKIFFDILVQRSLDKFSFAVSKNEVEREKKEKITHKDLDQSVGKIKTKFLFFIFFFY